MFKNAVIVYSLYLGRRADNWNVKMQMYLDTLYKCKKKSFILKWDTSCHQMIDSTERKTKERRYMNPSFHK